MTIDTGRSASPSGHSQAEPEEVSALRASVPNAATIYARASAIAKERYPEGAGATVLANIVREAAREMGLTSQQKVSERVRNQNEGRHNRLERLPETQQVEAQRICAERSGESPSGGPPCTNSGFVCYRCQDLAAEAVEQSERTGA